MNGDYFLSARPAFPWSLPHAGMPLFFLTAALLVVLTLWAYLRHPQSTRRRVTIVMALRLAALALALLTSLRPSIGFQEDPKLPSHLLVGIDISESMTVKDEVNSQTRIDAVRKTLEKCQPIFDELQSEQNVTVHLYGFGPSDFNEATVYDPTAPAVAKKSDYGAYLSRTLERWRPERFNRGHVLIGDGVDNGTVFNALTEAGRWRSVAPLHTVAVGRTDSSSNARDVAVTQISCDPEPVPIKTDLVVKAIVNQVGFTGSTVPAVLSIDEGEGFKEVRVERFKLERTIGNEVVFRVKAPGKAGEVKVKVEVPPVSVPGDIAPGNNARQTYLTVTKEGMRVLFIDRWRFEGTRIVDAWRADKRIDVTRILRQDDSPADGKERAAIDFETNAYDAIILGNISVKQLRAMDPRLPEKIYDQVIKKGTGLLFLGGEVSFNGEMRGTPLETLLPVRIDQFSAESRMADQPDSRFQTVPTDEGLNHYLMKVTDNPATTKKWWTEMNATDSRAKLTGLSKFGDVKRTATILAYADPGRQPDPIGNKAYRLPILLAVHQIGVGNQGRVAAFAGQDSYIWEAYGMKTNREGTQLHRRFWKQMILWLAHQDLEEGSAYARPQYRELPAGSEQTVKVGLRGPGGAEVKDATYQVKVIPPGKAANEGEAKATLADPQGGAKAAFNATVAGEYTVTVVASGKDAKGEDVKGEASVRFFAYPDVSDEMLRTAADHEYLKSLASAGGGQFLRLDDLPQYFRSLIGQSPPDARPKPKFYPDWRRDYSKGFLPIWLVVFVALIGLEWGLRRLWGMV
ncbi:MAG: hypothetical protein U0798_13130 [Gemmataceae bacterium]